MKNSMPDILGYWDRRADDPDFNPQTRQIEEGYAERQKEKRKRAEAHRKRNRKRVLGFFSRNSISKSLLDSLGFHIRSFGYDTREYSSENPERLALINKKGEDIARVSKAQRRIGAEITYGKPHEDLPRTADAIRYSLELRELLKRKEVPFSETIPVEEAKNELRESLEEMNEKQEHIEDLLG